MCGVFVGTMCWYLYTFHHNIIYNTMVFTYWYKIDNYIVFEVRFFLLSQNVYQIIWLYLKTQFSVIGCECHLGKNNVNMSWIHTYVPYMCYLENIYHEIIYIMKICTYDTKMCTFITKISHITKICIDWGVGIMLRKQNVCHEIMLIMKICMSWKYVRMLRTCEYSLWNILCYEMCHMCVLSKNKSVKK